MLLNFGNVSEWSALERRETRRRYVLLAVLTGVLVFLGGLSAAAHHPGMAVAAAAGVVLGTVHLVRLRRRGAWGTTVTARRQRTAAIAAWTIGAALLGLAVLGAIDGLSVPAVDYVVICSGFAFLLAAGAYLYARFLEDAAGAVAPEPARVICGEPRGLRRGARSFALVVTPTRVAHLQVSHSGVSEVAAIVLADIAHVEADASRGRGSLVLRSADVELAVHRAPPSQVHAVLEALRSAGVVAGA
jgi:hypothetical protein